MAVNRGECSGILKRRRPGWIARDIGGGVSVFGHFHRRFKSGAAPEMHSTDMEAVMEDKR